MNPQSLGDGEAYKYVLPSHDPLPVADEDRYFQAAVETLELVHIPSSAAGVLPAPGYEPRYSKDSALTAFAQLGALRLNAARGLISLIDDKYQYILAESSQTLSLLAPPPSGAPTPELWLGSTIIPRKKGVCEHVLALPTSPDIDSNDRKTPAVIINDLLDDERFSYRSYVKDSPGYRFYVGVPLRTAWGAIIGAYCIFDESPRQSLDHESLLFLKGIARTVMNYLETCKVQQDHRRTDQMIRGLTSFVTGASALQTSPAQNTPTVQRPGVLSVDSDVKVSPSPDGSTSSRMSITAMDEPIIKPEIIPNDQDPSSSPPSASKPKFSESQRSRQAKVSSSLQDIILPAGAKEMFSRAASVIRESSDLEGVMILDASVATFGGAVNLPHSRVYDEASKSRNRSDQSSSSTDDSSTSGSESNTRKMCVVLGFANTKYSRMAGDDAEDHCHSFAESDLKRLLGKYPNGKIFNVDISGVVYPTEDVGPTYSGLDTEDDEKTHDRKPKARPTLQRMLKAAPGARSIALLPLWDYQRERWFAGCICWSTQPNRVLSPHVDLLYLQAFGNSIMTDLSRLDAITADRSKTTFVASISHELRCPLHGILGGIQFLHDTKVDSFQAAMLDSITVCGKTLLDTIDHVLDFAKVNSFHKKPGGRKKSAAEPLAIEEAGPDRQKSDPEALTSTVDLAALTEEVVEAIFAGHTWGASGSALSHPPAYSMVSLPPDGVNQNPRRVRIILDIPHRSNWRFTTQHGAWRRVVMNIFGNAMKYTKQGFIRVSLHTSPQTSDDEDRPPAKVVLRVLDSGIGISSDFLRRGLYTPFRQEDSFASGIGLGLSIVRQIVEGSGGKIDIKSQIGRGTEVKVTLPMPEGKILSRSPESSEENMAAVATRTLGLRACILESVPSGTCPDGGPSAMAEGQYQMSFSLVSALKHWFKMDAFTANDWTSVSADVIICLEPCFELLAAVRASQPPTRAPILIFIALDAAKEATLRADPRIGSNESIVQIMTQPCGPQKLAKTLNACLNRYEVTSVDPFQQPNELGPAPELLRRASIADSFTMNFEPFAQTLKSLPETPPPSYSSGIDPIMQHSPSPPPPSKARILIVDDNRINRLLLEAFMKKHGFPYEEATNGLEAVDAYKRNRGRFDYILMDLTMPYMDGITATKEIRRHERISSMQPTTVIALTGLASATARLDAIANGVNHFLTKPVKFAHLYDLLNGGTMGG
ncbi:hypothetical protein K490DRAFT_46548 [Saccharata proteae CBS 121410]|uniref:histidine kinase n=1 Tax=Saccharata proteae CBS 121410 TaxID=1314787 RepID=A0A9P4HTS2_9PEZI|nr:hypothetical protein K490DRAFT_46548 [Saccharata proteae CBS 121410]